MRWDIAGLQKDWQLQSFPVITISRPVSRFLWVLGSLASHAQRFWSSKPFLLNLEILWKDSLLLNCKGLACHKADVSPGLVIGGFLHMKQVLSHILLCFQEFHQLSKSVFRDHSTHFRLLFVFSPVMGDLGRQLPYQNIEHLTIFQVSWATNSLHIPQLEDSSHWWLLRIELSLERSKAQQI